MYTDRIELLNTRHLIFAQFIVDAAFYVYRKKLHSTRCILAKRFRNGCFLVMAGRLFCN